MNNLFQPFSPNNSTSLDTCPIARAARLVGDTWTLLIVRALMSGSKRFTELQDGVGGVSSGTLSQRLKLLEGHDLITRQAYAEIPPRVEYHLTDKGKALATVMVALGEFGARFLCDGSTTHEGTRASATSKPDEEHKIPT